MGFKGGMAGLLIATAMAMVPVSASADLQLAAAELPNVGHSLVAQDMSSEANSVTVNQSNGKWAITDTAGISTFPPDCTKPGLPTSTIVICDATPFQILDFELGAGDDLLQMSGNYHGGGVPNDLVDVTAALGPGADIFLGANGTNLAVGGPGRDEFAGGPLLDRLVGGSGADLLKGNGGTDELYGRAGTDSLFGGAGRKDLLVGGTGKDRCVGEPHDLVTGCETVKVHR